MLDSPIQSGDLAPFSTAPSRSLTPMTDSNVVSLITAIMMFTSAGTTAVTACGRTIRRSAAKSLKPTVVAASTWPRPTDCRPPRNTSAAIAALKSANAMTARVNRSTFMPLGRNIGNSVAAMKSTASSGTERMPSTNTPHSQRATGSRERRPSARHSPTGSAVAKVASVTTSVSSSPPQSVGTTTGRGPPPISSRKNATGRRTKPSSTRCRLAACERRTTQVQNSANAAKQIHARHNSPDG